MALWACTHISILFKNSVVFHRLDQRFSIHIWSCLLPFLPRPFILFSCFWDRVPCSVHSVVQTNWEGTHYVAQLGLKLTTILLFLLFKSWDCSHEHPQPTFLPACCPPASPLLPSCPPSHLSSSLFSHAFSHHPSIFSPIFLSLPQAFHTRRWALAAPVLRTTSLSHVCFMQLGLTSTCRDASEFIRPFFPLSSALISHLCSAITGYAGESLLYEHG